MVISRQFTLLPLFGAYRANISHLLVISRMPMHPLVKSLSIVALTITAASTVAAQVSTKSSAYFSSTSSMAGNVMNTDVVKVVVDYGHDNYTAPMDYITAPGSTYGISASMINKSLAFPVRAYVSVSDQGSDKVLWDAMIVTIRQSYNGPIVYQGPLNKLGTKKLLDKNGYDLLINPGQETGYYSLSMTLPDNGQDQSALMGKTLKFSWDFTGEVGTADLSKNL
jgi:hypothetical protein